MRDSERAAAYAEGFRAGREVTDEMVERAARALCDHENEVDAINARVQGLRESPLRYEDFSDEFDAAARVILRAALAGPASGSYGEDPGAIGGSVR